MIDSKELEIRLSSLTDSINLNQDKLTNSTHNDLNIIKDTLRWILGYSNDCPYAEYMRSPKEKEMIARYKLLKAKENANAISSDENAELHKLIPEIDSLYR